MKLNKTTIIQFSSVLALFLAALIISLVFFNKKVPGNKRIFIFPSADSGEFVVEYRYLNKTPVQGEINLYIDEILLGSGVERTKKLFSPGTKVISCFEREGILYLDLSGDLLQKGRDVLEIQDGIDLLIKNIQKNFPKVKEVVLYVDGEQANAESESWEL